ncbi:MAG: FAD-dependent oxidoreductase [Candidatus Palauibacterales bacterium]|nr:FAD-dependent oxidoreductase [Candidatus Palauibacterales bacterium]
MATSGSGPRRVAVVGGGVAGLVAAWLLGRRHEVVLFEARDRLGGHVRTLDHRDGRRYRRLDTGFIVFNRKTYPLLSGLFDRLGVPTRGTEMSFSLSCRDCGLEYGGRGIAGLMADPASLLREEFRALLRGYRTFAREGRRVLENGAAPGTVDDFARESGLPTPFVDHYLLPMASALWSAPLTAVRRFPARLLLSFFDDHGLLRLVDRPRWETVVGGSDRYVRRLVERTDARFLTGSRVEGLRRTADGVELRLADGRSGSFDRAVVATHADQALGLLADPSPEERETLSAWTYTTSDAWLHSDSTFLPDRQPAWCSWNYRLKDCRGRDDRPRVTYYLNRLQRIDGERPYLVTLNPSRRPDPDGVLDRTTFRHPAYGPSAVGAQSRLRELSGRGRIHFCGAHEGYGFHEDAVRSAFRAADELGAGLP